jgi:hypothetical protein
MVPGASEGTFWELEQILGEPTLAHKTVMVLPSERMFSGNFDVESMWERAHLACRSTLHVPFPRYDPGGLIFGYSSQGDHAWQVTVRRFSWGVLEGALNACRSTTPS